jgi:hypothetical protein
VRPNLATETAAADANRHLDQAEFFNAIGRLRSVGAQAVTDHTDFARPLITESIPAAFLSGELIIDVRLSENQVIGKRFELLSNRLLRDTGDRQFYYNLDSEINILLDQ